MSSLSFRVLSDVNFLRLFTINGLVLPPVTLINWQLLLLDLNALPSIISDLKPVMSN